MAPQRATTAGQLGAHARSYRCSERARERAREQLGGQTAVCGDGAAIRHQLAGRSRALAVHARQANGAVCFVRGPLYAHRLTHYLATDACVLRRRTSPWRVSFPLAPTRNRGARHGVFQSYV